MARRVLLFVGLLAISWCVMTVTHEFGHLLGGWWSGGTLKSADLWPWHLPHSLFDPNPQPLVTLAAGVVRQTWSWFVAYFCLLANGVYLALAWICGDRFLDTAQLLEQGASPLAIGAYCLLTIGFGYVRFRRSCLQVLFPEPARELPPVGV
jgi:hypothetical protein